MSAPNVKDLATSLVATAPSPAASGTSLVVTTNQGSRFPAVPFDAIVHPADQLPTVATAERVLVTALTGDTMTIDRAEGITSAQDIDVGWRISAAIFTDHITGAYARANHTGTQAASTISDFDTEVSNNTDVAANTAARHTHANQAVLDATTASFTTADETKLDGIEAAADVTDAGNVGSSIHGATAKTTPVDADTMPLIDSAASNVLKKVTWANIKATLKTYYDSLYAAATHTHAQSDITNLTTDLAGKQPLDSDLTAIGGLSPSNDDVIQRKSGAWTNRTMAQVKTDLALTSTDVGLGNLTNFAQLKVNSNLTDVNSAVDAFNNIKQDASTVATGVVELASVAEVNTGTDAGRVVSPDTLAGSYAGTKQVSVYAVEAATALTTGDGKAYFRIPTTLNGMNLVSCAAAVIAKSTSGLPTIQIARGRQSSATSAHTFADMLTTKVTIDANEFDSKDAATAAVIDGSNDDVLTGDLIRIDVDVAGTAATGLIVTLSFRLP